MRKVRGEITVFLSFILILILAFVGTMIEVVRVNISKVFAERALITAMDSTAASYYVPLYSDYHLMLFDMGYQTKIIDENKTIDGIKEYMQYTFMPNKDLKVINTPIQIPNVNLYNITTKELNITDKVLVTDYKGELFINEAVQYMKYKTDSELLEKFLRKLSMLKTTKVEANLMKEKLTVEENLSVLDKFIMNLMQLVEGLSFNKNSLKIGQNGLIKTEDNFVKKLCVQEATMERVGINHNLVYQSLKTTYCNPINYLDNIIKAVSTIKACKIKKIELEREKDVLINQRTGLTQNSNKTINKEFEKEINQKSNKKINKGNVVEENNQLAKQLERVNEAMNQVEKELEVVGKEEENAMTIINQNKIDYSILVDNVLSKIEAALEIIHQYEEKQVALLTELNTYEKQVENKKSELDEDFYLEIKQEINSMKAYGNIRNENDIEGTNISNIKSMRINLNQNKEILESTLEFKNIVVINDDVELEKILTKAVDIKEKLAEYSTKEIRFDYSNLVINSNVRNPINNFKELIKNGILGLIIDDVDLISKKELEVTNLPSINEGLKSKEDTKDTELTELLENSEEEGYSSGITDTFSELEKNLEKINPEKDSINNIVKTLLLHSYIIEHFKQQGNNRDKVKPTALEYEQEYILIGNKSDYFNFKSVTSRILLMRTLINCIYLISNQDASNKAYTTAAAIVGFTGFTPLIQLTKTILLMVWSYEEALIDTSAIIKNKSVPLFKNKSNFHLKYEDMFKVNKQYIKEIVEKMEKCSESENEFTYSDYINALLFLGSSEDLSYRAMDLIQCNMNLRNDGEFLMSNCVFGFKVKADFSIPTKFINLPFVKMLININQNSYEYNMERAYSY